MSELKTRTDYETELLLEPILGCSGAGEEMGPHLVHMTKWLVDSLVDARMKRDSLESSLAEKEADYFQIKAKLQTAEATLGTLMLWIEEANAKVTDEEWDRCMKTPSGMVTRPRVDNMLASRFQQLREKVAGLQLKGSETAPVPSGASPAVPEAPDPRHGPSERSE